MKHVPTKFCWYSRVQSDEFLRLEILLDKDKGSLGEFAQAMLLPSILPMTERSEERRFRLNAELTGHGLGYEEKFGRV